jgi:deoxyadenosine/deoxycytidine kinase
MHKARYIVVEGPIGVGKTSLATLLAKEFDARTLFENVDDNPFLPEFYRERERNAFKTQLFFLLSRYQQQLDLGQTDLFQKTTISDYLFAKDRLFAQLTLDEHELMLYDKVFGVLDPHIPRPDLVIYLQAEIEVLQKRIKTRNISYEKSLDAEYLIDLLSLYNDYFFHYTETPLLVINTSEIDFVSNRADLDQLIREIREFKSGTQYFVPLGSGP